MNQQNPYMMPNMPGFPGGGMGPGFPGGSMGPGPVMPGHGFNPNACHCTEEINRIENRMARMERQIRRLETRVSRLEGGFPVPLMANDANNNNDNYNSGMYML